MADRASSLFFVSAECTSAVSSDVEGRMYEHAKSLGITLITISLRYVQPPGPPSVMVDERAR